MKLKNKTSDEIAISLLVILTAILLFVCIGLFCRNKELKEAQKDIHDSIVWYDKAYANVEGVSKRQYFELQEQYKYIKSLEQKLSPSRKFTVTYDTLWFNR